MNCFHKRRKQFRAHAFIGLSPNFHSNTKIPRHSEVSCQELQCVCPPVTSQFVPAEAYDLWVVGTTEPSVQQEQLVVFAEVEQMFCSSQLLLLKTSGVLPGGPRVVGGRLRRRWEDRNIRRYFEVRASHRVHMEGALKLHCFATCPCYTHL